jgi:hypothetical protein
VRQVGWSGLVLIAGLPLSLDAQLRTMSPVPSCPECGVRFETALTLDSRDDGAALISFVQGATTDVRGRAGTAFGPEGPVHVFGPDGMLQGTVGRRGQGPGEFSTPSAVVAFADSVAVFDAGLGRVSIFDLEFRFSRGFRLPGQVFRGVAGEGRTLLVNGTFPTPEAAGYPFHVIDLATGTVLRSFGGDIEAGVGPAGPSLPPAFMARDSASGELWTVLRHRPLLQRWSGAGEHLETTRINLPWFPEGGRAALGSPTRPPHPAVTGLLHDGEHLWVSFQLPHENWRQAWPRGAAPQSGHPRPEDLPRRDALYTGRLIALDRAGGGVVGSWDVDLLPSIAATFPGGLARMRDPGGFYPALEVIRPSLTPPAGR